MRRFILAWAIPAIAMLWPVCSLADGPNNDKVAHEIHDKLKASGRMAGSSFVIKYQDGTAWLEGKVSSEGQKMLALKLTGEVPEVSDVVDHLQVVAPAKPTNPVMRLLQKPFEKKPAQQDAAPIAAGEKKGSITSWFSGPAVRAAKTPAPEVHDTAFDEGDVVTSDKLEAEAADVGPVYPEQLAEKKETSTNPLIRQAANLRSIFHKPAKAAPVAKQPLPEEVESTDDELARIEPRPIPQATPKCTTCTPVAQRTTAQRTATQAKVASSRKYKAPIPVRQTSTQAEPRVAGRVRMVPMMEMADGSLVPVEADYAPGASQSDAVSHPVRQTAAVSRSKTTKRTRQNVARRQEVIDGSLDGAPLPPSAAAPLPNGAAGGPLPAYVPGTAAGVAPAYYDQPHMPNYAWPSYAAYPNYAGLTYPRQYSPTAWPYIGPFYPYPQVPLGWRKVTLEWNDGWWFLDFDDTNRSYAY